MRELEIQWRGDAYGRHQADVKCPALGQRILVAHNCPGCAHWRWFGHKYAQGYHAPGDTAILLVRHDGTLATHVRCAFDERKQACPTCGQDLPDKQKCPTCGQEVTG